MRGLRICSSFQFRSHHIHQSLLFSSTPQANDLALALSRAYTGQEHVVVLDAAYHGHTTTMMDMSAYKHLPHDDDSATAAPATFPKPWVHVVPTPDTYRGKHTGPDAVARYAEAVAGAVVAAGSVEEKTTGKAKGGGVAAFFAEGVLACGGQVCRCRRVCLCEWRGWACWFAYIIETKSNRTTPHQSIP